MSIGKHNIFGELVEGIEAMRKHRKYLKEYLQVLFKLILRPWQIGSKAEVNPTTKGQPSFYLYKNSQIPLFI